MRVRTAVTIAVALVTAKAGLTAVVLTAWSAIPERSGPFDHWHIELGTVAEWLAAGAAAGAAVVALLIASRDRRDRKQERRDEEKTHARLVRLDVQSLSGRPVVVAKVRNFGPVLDVALADATWSEHPGARWGTNGLKRDRLARPILRAHQSDRPYEEMIDFDIWNMHPTEDKTLVPTADYHLPHGLHVAAGAP